MNCSRCAIRRAEEGDLCIPCKNKRNEVGWRKNKMNLKYGLLR